MKQQQDVAGHGLLCRCRRLGPISQHVSAQEVEGPVLAAADVFAEHPLQQLCLLVGRWCEQRTTWLRMAPVGRAISVIFGPVFIFLHHGCNHHHPSPPSRIWHPIAVDATRSSPSSGGTPWLCWQILAAADSEGMRRRT